MKLPTYFSMICLALTTASVHAKITHSELAENMAKGLRLLSFESGVEPVWKTEQERLDLKRAEKNFFDVTEVFDPDAPLVQLRKTTTLANFPPPSHQGAVKAVLAILSLPNIQKHVNDLSAFHDRYITTPGGTAAAKWVLKTVQDMIKKYPGTGATVKHFPHNWPQNSTIARIPGKTNGPVTIVSAHVDTINLDYGRLYDRAPGSDDDATGCAALLEAFRALIASGFKPTTPVEFHWVSGEEPGSLGSQAIAKSYKEADVKVKAMMNIVLAGYVKPGTPQVFSLMPDHVDGNLTKFLASIIDTYSDVPHVTNSECGYACSDHVSWYIHGYPVCFPMEGNLNQTDFYRHSALDTVDVPGFSWEHTFEFSRIVCAWMYELGA
ncbi:hypothetical protein DXG01_002392 [Tephrocybe rancida]|nr:hypothetical protein DXG01_002392 [Tephrocybe rancida]